jgi:hypothetical protein
MFFATTYFGMCSDHWKLATACLDIRGLHKSLIIAQHYSVSEVVLAMSHAVRNISIEAVR